MKKDRLTRRQLMGILVAALIGSLGVAGAALWPQEQEREVKEIKGDKGFKGVKEARQTEAKKPFKKSKKAEPAADRNRLEEDITDYESSY